MKTNIRRTCPSPLVANGSRVWILSCQFSPPGTPSSTAASTSVSGLTENSSSTPELRFFRWKPVTFVFHFSSLETATPVLSEPVPRMAPPPLSFGSNFRVNFTLSLVPSGSLTSVIVPTRPTYCLSPSSALITITFVPVPEPPSSGPWTVSLMLIGTLMHRCIPSSTSVRYDSRTRSTRSASRSTSAVNFEASKAATLVSWTRRSERLSRSLKASPSTSMSSRSIAFTFIRSIDSI